MALLHIAGGVALMLFGIRFLRKGLERMIGHALHAWIERMGANRWTAGLAGLAFGTVAPSSTAQTMFTMQLLNSRSLPPERMLVFLLGANVGITVMVQLISFQLADFHAVLLIAGVACYLWARSETWRGAGQTLLALGCIFLAMALIGDAARVLTANPDFQTVMSVVVHHKWLLLIFAAGLTFVTQSSTATIGLAIALAEAGTGRLEAVVPVVLGTNMGLGLTSLAAGWPTLAGKRLATANLVLKSAVVLPAMLAFDTVLGWIEAMPGEIGRQAANVHTGFNLIVAVVGAMLAGVVGRLVTRTVREAPREASLSGVTTHLDPAALAIPVFALANASRETLRLAEEVRNMLTGAWRGYLERNAVLIRQVQQHDDRVDELHAAIKHYLSRIPAEAMTPRDSTLQFGLLHFASQLESIGDILDKNFCHQLLKQVVDPAPWSREDETDLAEMHARTLRRLETAIMVLTTRDHGTAAEFLREGDTVKNWCIEMQKRHYQRVVGSDPDKLEASTRFLDLINALRRISGQLNTIGHTFADDKAPE
ncbi:MAG TPA: Na/Pi cotransporter family protein [Candidatus Didemnitutus sp.]|nr:Na/Pi cotransporter family protein [Candidatus Didemnitutus sp.]